MNFESGKATITKDSDVSLRKVVDIMEAFPEITFEIVGHTDNVGNPAKNKKLSAERGEGILGRKRNCRKSYGDKRCW